MVTVVEKLMPKNYYTCGLAAAQADQVCQYCSSMRYIMLHFTACSEGSVS